MSAAMDHLKSWLLKHGAGGAVEEAAAAMAGRPDAEARLRLEQATQRLSMEIHGMSPTMANGLAAAFAALVKERLAKAAPQARQVRRVPGKKFLYRYADGVIGKPLTGPNHRRFARVLGLGRGRHKRPPTARPI
jgi:hypothetical protein